MLLAATGAYYRPGVDGKFEAENINPHLCTHINYGFAKLDASNRIALYDVDLDSGDEDWSSGLTWGHGMIRRMNELRNYNPNLATLISIGGWNEGSNKYSAMVSNPASRATFVESCVQFLKKYELDGLDFDWEYPGMKAAGEADRVPGRDEDKEDYVKLLRELRSAFEPYGFLLTAAVSAGKPTIDRAYNVPEVSSLLNLIFVMTYDFWGGWSPNVWHNAPLYPLENATGIDKEFTTQFAIDYWIEKGADPAKLIQGFPLYGRTFTLKDSKDNGLGAPAIGKGGNPGPITRIIGMLGYNEICSMVQNGWQEHYNETQEVAYATNGNQFVGYDNVRSIKKKLDFLLSRKLGGAMIWSIDTDDFSGHCGAGKYPLLKTLSRTLNKIDGPDVKIPRTHATTPRPNSGSSSTSSRPWEWTTVRPSTTSARPSTQKLTTISQKVPSTNKPTEALPTTTRPIAQPEPNFTCTKA
ncbi:PREDICTED: chitinase-3-like protein 1, partial [Rhagoletis zephyria]|uniref:chitinase-3-like protein 1 n=1 Tax=Rhagoletis zephyria TaxID=28612 RepID=UPI0008116712